MGKTGFEDYTNAALARAIELMPESSGMTPGSQLLLMEASRRLAGEDEKKDCPDVETDAMSHAGLEDVSRITADRVEIRVGDLMVEVRKL